jgi:hypothetical protein
MEDSTMGKSLSQLTPELSTELRATSAHVSPLRRQTAKREGTLRGVAPS